MKLEPGRFYSTADGRRIGPAVLEGERRGIEGRWSMSGHDYDDDGHATSGPSIINDAVFIWAAGPNTSKVTMLERPEAPIDAESRDAFRDPAQIDKRLKEHWDAGRTDGGPREFTKAPSVEDLTSFGLPRQGEAIMDDQTARAVEEKARSGFLRSHIDYLPYEDAKISWVPTLNLRYATSFDRRHVLQQQWVEAGGRTEWRDVPRVTT